MMGTLVKRRWCAAAGLDPAAVYHCAVMPCYDKKLEAAREDFWVPGEQQWLLVRISRGGHTPSHARAFT